MKRYLPYLLLVFLLFLPTLSLFTPGLPVTHDNVVHTARIASFYKSLLEGNVIPRWAGDLNWGFGHPILMFVYPLPSYLASLIHSVGFTYVSTVKIIYGISFITSGILMFLWAKEEFGEKAGCATALLYSFAPYRFVDLYVRGALGEHIAFIFPPLVLYAMFKTTAIKNEKKYLWIALASLAVAALVLSHNMLAIVFLPVIAGYALVLALRQKKRLVTVVLCLLPILIGFLLSAFFWIPALLERKYTLIDIVTKGEVLTRFETFQRLVYSPWKYAGTGEFSVQLGVVGLIFLVLSLIQIRKIAKEKKLPLYVLSLILFIVSIFMMLPLSTYLYTHISVLANFQFPWRFLSLSITTLAIIGGITIFTFKDSTQKIVVALSTAALLLLTYSYWKPVDYKVYPDTYFENEFQGTTDTGESSPIWSVRFMEKEASQKVIVADGDAIIEDFSETSTRKTFYLSSNTPSKVVLNTLYFPGWKIYINDQEQTIEFQDQSYHGLITFNVPEGHHKVQAFFESTKVRDAAVLVSLVSWVAFISFVLIISTKKLWKKRN